MVCSRLADGYHLTEDALKHLQHVFTVWFPRRIYKDLTDDTVRVDVIVRKGYASGKSVYNATFLKADGSTAKTETYDEDRLTGASCDLYDQRRSGYFGKKDGFDYRMVVYMAPPSMPTRR